MNQPRWAVQLRAHATQVMLVLTFTASDLGGSSKQPTIGDARGI